MTIVAVVEAAVIVAAVFLFLRHLEGERSRTDVRERELLSRIQHPERVPVEAAQPFVFPEQPLDEIELVGVIQDPGEPE